MYVVDSAVLCLDPLPTTPMTKPLGGLQQLREGAQTKMSLL